MINKKSLALFIFILVAPIMSWKIISLGGLSQNLNPSQKVVVKDLLSNVKTQCIGRYLIDVPSQYFIHRTPSDLVSNTWDADVSDSSELYKTYIATQKMYFPSFVSLIHRREKELSEKNTINPENMPFLKKSWKLTDGHEGVIFERNENESTDDAIRILEAYYYSNGVAVKIQKQTINDSSSRYEIERGGDMPRNNVPKDIGKMLSLITRVSGRSESNIPTKPGICIPDAFIESDSGRTEQENISIVLLSDKLKNIYLTINSDNFTRENSGVLERTDEIARLLEQTGGRIKRKNSFTNHGLHAEELLAIGSRTPNNEPRYHFDLYINETTSYKNPNFILTLNNQEKIDAGYDQDEIIAFWDYISRTIRLRPNAI